MKSSVGEISAMSSIEAIEYTAKSNPNAVITVGVIKDGLSSYTVYGQNGKEIPSKLFTYEIGSITKTFTAALINRAIQEEKIDIGAAIDQYLDLPKGKIYPTVEELLTHTSGYRNYYLERPIIHNFLKGRNGFFGVSKEMVMNRAGKLSCPNKRGHFNYSNFGYAVLSLILEAVYKKEYTTLMNEFVLNDLKLPNTKISDQNGDLGKYWDWHIDDAYLAAGALISDINDMLAYAQIQLDRNELVANCHKGMKKVDISAKRNKMPGINVDQVGMSWMIDEKNGIIWHNGGTGNYNSYLGFDLDAGAAVVVLSNLSPFKRVSATALGAKVFAEFKR